MLSVLKNTRPVMKIVTQMPLYSVEILTDQYEDS